MRILFTFVGGRGHFEPLAPIARAAARAGHSVAFGCSASMRTMVGGSGFAVFRIGVEPRSAPRRLDLQPVDVEREERDLCERFVRRAASQRAPSSIDLCKDWRPDVVICDETDFGTLVAAESLGLPFATIQVLAAGSFVREEVVAEALDELRSEHQLSPDPQLTMLSRYLVLSPFPPSFRDPAHPAPATLHPLCAMKPRPRGDELPPWAAVRPGAPTVYFTLGTTFNLESGDLLERAVNGLRELPINLLVTVGSDIDPDELGTQPTHVHVTRYLPQSAVLPYCDAVVSHAGSGSVVGALTHGLPLVAIPIGADQPLNAERCAQLGVGRVLDAMGATSESIAQAVTDVLGDPAFREHAVGIRDEIAELPGLKRALELIETLVVTRRPVLASSANHLALQT